jgi:hypothetical protein
MSQELLFELDKVRITPYLAQFGATSYQIASISSVRALQSRKLSRIAIFVFFLGVALFVVAMARSGTEQRADANFSLAVIAAAIAFASVFVQLIIPRRIYKLILRTHGRDVEVLTSTRSKFILDVKRAVEEAFIAHARRSNPDH